MGEFTEINIEVIKRDESRQLKAVAIDMHDKNIDLFESGHIYRDSLKPYVKKFGYERVNEYLKSLADEMIGVIEQPTSDPEFDV